MDIEYALEGIGANERPYGLFIVDPKTGFIRVTKVLDREVIDTYNVSDTGEILLYFPTYQSPCTCQRPIMFANVQVETIFKE